MKYPDYCTEIQRSCLCQFVNEMHVVAHIQLDIDLPACMSNLWCRL